jgi:hypothetical protein
MPVAEGGLREGEVTMPKLTSVVVSLKLPFLGDINGTWEPDETEQRAAWEMYVELVTRVSLVELQPGEGLLHEALASLYTLFESTRKILREYGPAVARPKGEGQLAFGYLAIAIINCVIRPLLTQWHPKLLHYQSMRTDTRSSVLYEQQWEDSDRLRQELNHVHSILRQYADLLAQIAEVPPLIL